MVTIVAFEKRKNQKDQDFNVLIIQGGVEAVTSKQSGKPYLTARKTSIPCTFDDEFAKNMVGSELPGEIQRIECEEYTYEIPGTKDKIKLSHTYVYSPEPVTLEEKDLILRCEATRRRSYPDTLIGTLPIFYFLTP